MISKGTGTLTQKLDATDQQLVRDDGSPQDVRQKHVVPLLGPLIRDQLSVDKVDSEDVTDGNESREGGRGSARWPHPRTKGSPEASSREPNDGLVLAASLGRRNVRLETVDGRERSGRRSRVERCRKQERRERVRSEEMVSSPSRSAISDEPKPGRRTYSQRCSTT
jgi:hypothetical protein